MRFEDLKGECPVCGKKLRSRKRLLVHLELHPDFRFEGGLPVVRRTKEGLIFPEFGKVHGKVGSVCIFERNPLFWRGDVYTEVDCDTVFVVPKKLYYNIVKEGKTYPSVIDVICKTFGLNKQLQRLEEIRKSLWTDTGGMNFELAREMDQIKHGILQEELRKHCKLPPWCNGCSRRLRCFLITGVEVMKPQKSYDKE